MSFGNPPIGTDNEALRDIAAEAHSARRLSYVAIIVACVPAIATVISLFAVAHPNSLTIEKTAGVKNEDQLRAKLAQEVENVKNDYTACLKAAQNAYDTWASQGGVTTLTEQQMQLTSLQSEKSNCEQHYRDSLLLIEKGL